jgi:hypothetical protein
MTERSYGGGAWRGELHLVLLEDKRHASTRAGRSLWAVASALTYTTHAGDRITLPDGFVTDLASIPRPAWSLLPPDGPWALAAVFHDLLYRTKGTGIRWEGQVPALSRGAPYTRAEADEILLQAMEDLEVSWLDRRVIWAAVRLGGAAGWGH